MKNHSNRFWAVLILTGALAFGIRSLVLAVSPSPWSAFRKAPVKDAVGNWEGLSGSAASARAIRVIGASVPLTGTVRLLAIPVAFQPDKDETTSGNGTFPYRVYGPASEPGYLQSRLNELTRYYDEVSGHRVQLRTTLTDIVTLGAPKATYATMSSQLMEDVIAAADGWINFAQCDIIMLIHAGSGEENILEFQGMPAYKGIWSHLSRTLLPINTNDGAVIAAWVEVPETECHDSWFVAYNPLEYDSEGNPVYFKMSDYEKDPSIVPNPNIPPTIDVLGTWAHEVGHAFGMADLYDTSGSSFTGLSLASWSIMAEGNWLGMGYTPCHPDAWHKKLLNWTTVVNVTDRRLGEAIPAQSASTGMVYRMWTNGDISSAEYFLLENRQQIGFDVEIPESGLMIYHINDDAGLLSMNNLQQDRSHSRITPVSADNILDPVTYYTGVGDERTALATTFMPLFDTAFPGNVNNTHFGVDTLPASDKFNTTPSYVDVRNIRIEGNFIYADLRTTSGTTITFVNPLPDQTIYVTQPMLRAIAPKLVDDSVHVFVDDVEVTGVSYTAETGELSCRIGPLTIGTHQARVTGRDEELDTQVTAVISFTVAGQVVRAGARMISLPVTGVGTARTVFGGTSDPLLAWYDPAVGEYALYPQPSVELTNPTWAAYRRDVPTESYPPAGRAFWAKMPVNTTLRLAGEYLSTNQQFVIPVRRGFNMIGTPYSTPVSFGSLQVEYRGSTYTINEAVHEGLIDPVLYTWNGREYILSELPFGTLDPWVGYWIHVRANTSTEPLKLVFLPSPRGRAIVAPVKPRATSDALWQLRLTANDTASQCRSSVTLGISSGATDQVDAGMDLIAPPAPQDGVSLVSHPDHAASLLRDMRAPAEQATYTWELLVTGVAGSRIALSWPDLSRVPSHYAVTLRDTVTGEERYLRTTQSYTMNFGAQEQQRRLTLTASPGGVGRVQIHQLQTRVTRTTGAVAITCQLTTPAAVSVDIRTITGKLIARIPTATRAQGAVSLTWNGRGLDGRLLPRGVYQCQVTAVAGTGQTVKAVTLIQR